MKRSGRRSPADPGGRHVERPEGMLAGFVATLVLTALIPILGEFDSLGIPKSGAK
jgi:hypothetical protein